MDNYLTNQRFDGNLRFLSTIPIELTEIIISYLDVNMLDVFIGSKMIDITRLNWNRVYKNRRGKFPPENLDKDRYALRLNVEDILFLGRGFQQGDEIDDYASYDIYY